MRTVPSEKWKCWVCGKTIRAEKVVVDHGIITYVNNTHYHSKEEIHAAYLRITGGTDQEGEEE